MHRRPVSGRFEWPTIRDELETLAAGGNLPETLLNRPSKLDKREWTKILGWPGYRVYRSEINEAGKTFSALACLVPGPANRRSLCDCGRDPDGWYSQGQIRVTLRQRPQ